MTAKLPSRLHHTAYVAKDLEATRHFYEDILGFPLVATWCEQEELFGKERTYCHCFFGLADGSALAFFQFADPADADEYAPKRGMNPYLHVALSVDEPGQREIGERLAAEGQEPLVIDHGYCVSMYTMDPNGLLLEFTVDHPDAESVRHRLRGDRGVSLRPVRLRRDGA